MKVLMISKALIVEVYQKKLYEIARNKSIELHLVIPTRWGKQIPENTIAENFTIHLLPTLLSGYNHFHFYKGLWHLMNQLRPEIVHIDEEHYSFVTFQSMIFSRFISAKTLFFTWQNIDKSYPFPFNAIEKFSLKTANHALVGNQEAAEILKKKGYNKSLTLIPQFGVDETLYYPQNKQEIRQKYNIRNCFTIGYIGRFVPEKGLEDLFHAFTKLTFDCQLIMIGSGEYLQNLLYLANQLKIQEKIIFIHQVPSTELPHYYSILDCLILPSRTKANWKEQFGRVLIEAMSCEIPVIGSNSGEIPFVIGDTGLIFAEANIQELSNQIKRLHDDDDLRLRLAKHGRIRVLQNYTQSIIAKKTIDVYKSL